MSSGWRRQWMIRARGKARWIRPSQRKFAGILSVTRAASGARRRSNARYSADRAADEGGPVAAAPALANASARSCQNGSSPPAPTTGWRETICSTRVVPDRGMPRISRGFRRWSPSPACAAKNSAVKVAITRSTEAPSWARSNCIRARASRLPPRNDACAAATSPRSSSALPRPKCSAIRQGSISPGRVSRPPSARSASGRPRWSVWTAEGRSTWRPGRLDLDRRFEPGDRFGEAALLAQQVGKQPPRFRLLGVAGDGLAQAGFGLGRPAFGDQHLGASISGPASSPARPPRHGGTAASPPARGPWASSRLPSFSRASGNAGSSAVTRREGGDRLGGPAELFQRAAQVVVMAEVPRRAGDGPLQGGKSLGRLPGPEMEQPEFAQDGRIIRPGLHEGTEQGHRRGELPGLAQAADVGERGRRASGRRRRRGPGLWLGAAAVLEFSSASARAGGVAARRAVLGHTISPGHPAFSRIACNNTGFRIGDASGGGNAYHVRPDGTSDTTIAVFDATGNGDGPSRDHSPAIRLAADAPGMTAASGYGLVGQVSRRPSRSRSGHRRCLPAGGTPDATLRRTGRSGRGTKFHDRCGGPAPILPRKRQVGTQPTAAKRGRATLPGRPREDRAARWKSPRR